MNTTEDVDVVVVGGGPGGSTVAALTARQGHRVLLLEKETFPRYQIGESLLPATVHGVCRMLGVTDELAEAGFTLKRGGTFRWGANPEPWTFAFAYSPRMVGSTSFAYQVERMKFDDILLKNAARCGAEVRHRCTVLEAFGDEQRVRGVRYTDESGRERRVTARYVVDASGNTSRINSAAGGARRYSEFFQNLALFGYFEGGKRMPEPDSGNILCAAFEDGWFWYIPLSDRLTSVGAVVRRDAAANVQGDPEKALTRMIERCPMISDYLSGASLVRSGPYGRLRVRKDYSYSNTAFWRPGMVLVGDAACFIDPVFSSGVHLATYSGVLAARSINSVLAERLAEQRVFAEFEARYRREYSLFYQFLLSFYELHVDEKSYFWQAKKITSCPSSELEAFAELVGGVASADPALPGSADVVGEQLRATSQGIEAAVERISRDADGGMGPILGVPAVAGAMREGGHLQARAVLGDDFGSEEALFTGGLVPSPDGAYWQEA
jgi:halogenation protein CepH